MRSCDDEMVEWISRECSKTKMEMICDVRWTHAQPETDDGWSNVSSGIHVVRQFKLGVDRLR